MMKSNVKISRIDENHASFIQNNVSHERVAATCNIPFPYPTKGAIQWINKVMKEVATGKRSTFIILCQNQPVGVIDLKDIDHKTGSAELGYWLVVDFWNRGIMSEATKQVITRAFSELKLSCIESRVLASNQASSRVLEKNSFWKYDEKVDESETRFKGQVWNHYRLTKGRWGENFS